MNKGKSLLEHDQDILNRMQDVLAVRFFKYNNTLPAEEFKAEDNEQLGGMARTIANIINVATSVEKVIRLEQRLVKIEKKLSVEEKISIMKMFNDPIEIQSKYR